MAERCQPSPGAGAHRDRGVLPQCSWAPQVLLWMPVDVLQSTGDVFPALELVVVPAAWSSEGFRAAGSSLSCLLSESVPSSAVQLPSSSLSRAVAPSYHSLCHQPFRGFIPQSLTPGIPSLVPLLALLCCSTCCFQPCRNAPAPCPEPKHSPSAWCCSSGGSGPCWSTGQRPHHAHGI